MARNTLFVLILSALFVTAAVLRIISGPLEQTGAYAMAKLGLSGPETAYIQMAAREPAPARR